MRHGIVLFTCDRRITPAQAAKAAEQRGFSAFYVPEHTHIPVKREAPHPRTGDATLPDDRYLRTLDPWVSLATAATVTSQIRLATAVALPVESDPITLAKTIATLDHLSGGRVTLGAGSGGTPTNSPIMAFQPLSGAPCCVSTSRPCARSGRSRKPPTAGRSSSSSRAGRSRSPSRRMCR
jgi:alkanesulfonate monooxygenase SsuD/methylene tetrahydromethanopterin reductase-like flavin-dependent oxidoreductase (luciferase family)